VGRCKAKQTPPYQGNDPEHDSLLEG